MAKERDKERLVREVLQDKWENDIWAVCESVVSDAQRKRYNKTKIELLEKDLEEFLTTGRIVFEETGIVCHSDEIIRRIPRNGMANMFHSFLYKHDITPVQCLSDVVDTEQERILELVRKKEKGLDII